MALAVECLGANCNTYGRRLITTSRPIADCDTLAVVLGNAQPVSGSCAGRIQLRGDLEVALIRCCEPSPTLTDAGGYTPPSAEAIQAASACIARDAWSIWECVTCQACDVLGAVKGVTACCNEQTGAPSIVWGGADACRYATIRVPLVFTACCPEA